MADNKSREVSKLHVKVEVDVSEALVGLKALQREAKKATQELRGWETVYREYDPQLEMYVDGFEDDVHEYRVKEHATQPGTGVVIDDTIGKPIVFFDINVFSTEALSEELAKRKGVTSIYFDKGDTEFTQITIDWRK